MLPGLFTQLLIIPHPGMSAKSPLLRLRPDHWNISFLKPGDAYDVNLYELGTTSDQPAVRVSVQAPLGWKGYAYELFGTYERPESPPEAFRFQLLGTIAFSELRGVILDGPILIAWRRRVLCEGTSISIEAYWCPAMRETRLRIEGSAKDMRNENLEQAISGMRLLNAIERRGRTPGIKICSRETFYAGYPPARAEAQRRRGRLPVRDEDIVRTFRPFLSLSTFKRCLRQYGRPP